MNNNHEVETTETGSPELTPEMLTPEQRDVLAYEISDPDNFIQYLYPSTWVEVEQDQQNSVNGLRQLIVQITRQAIEELDQEYNEDEIEKFIIWETIGVADKTEEEIDSNLDILAVAAQREVESEFAKNFVNTREAYRHWKKLDEEGKERARQEIRDFVDYRKQVRDRVYRKLIGEEPPEINEGEDW